MPGKKNDSKTPADTTQQAESAGAAAPETTAAPIDLMAALAVGNPALEPVAVTFHGLDFSIRRFYPPEEIWELSDLQRVVFPVTNPDGTAIPEEQIALLLVDNLIQQLKHLVVKEDHPQVAELVAKWENRPPGEINRMVRYLYQLAGITSPQGEFLAS